MAKEQPRKAVSTHQTDLDMKLLISLVTYKTSTHKTKNVKMWGGIYTCSLICCSRVSPASSSPQPNYVTDLMHWLYDKHHYYHQHLKMASDWLKTCYDHLANSQQFHEREQIWLYHPL
jgi:hypothetical protein